MVAAPQATSDSAMAGVETQRDPVNSYSIMCLIAVLDYKGVI
jgi:hypothetical protein